jgi:uncharacterized protein YggU (UPF0235/DUF167 family)
MKIRVKVKPDSKTGEVSREGDSFIIKVKEPPKESKANQPVISNCWQSISAFPGARSRFSTA